MSTPAGPVFSALRRMQLARELRRVTASGDPGTVVDVGCGTGDFATVVTTHGVRVVAADAGPRPAGLADGVVYARFDFDTYQLDGIAPDTVILRHVLEHVRDPVACLRGLQRQGARRFYIVVPNAGSREARLLGARWYLWDPPRHLWHFDQHSLAGTCARAGLAIDARGTDTAPILLPSLYRSLRLAGWPASIYERFGPTSLLTALSAPVNWLLPGNVLWCTAAGG
jgi:SAM-dependent methyltransferase